MKRLNLTHTLALLIGVAVMCFQSIAAEDTAETVTFAGRVVEESGEPVVGVTVALMPVEDGNGAWFPIDEWPNDPWAFSAVTDAQGEFAITDFIPGPMLFGLLPYHEPKGHGLSKVNIGGVSHYPTEREKGGSIVFAVAEGTRIINVEVTVRRLMEIRGKVLQMDGTPLADADIKLDIRTEALNGSASSSGSYGRLKTDAAGIFVKYLADDDEGPAEISPAWFPEFPSPMREPDVQKPSMHYIVAVIYQGQRAQAKPFILEPGARVPELTFTYTAPLPPRAPDTETRRRAASASVSSGRKAEGVWIVNPANGHAYIKIQCSGPEDAISQASSEGAYLVSINDEAEQQWLERVFPPHPTLIGLNDIANEGEWRWHSGEPVTYTNWARHEPHDTDRGDEDYVIWYHRWEDIGPDQVVWRLLRTALLEKDVPPVED